MGKNQISDIGFPETADIETSSESYARRFSGEVGGWFLKVQELATLQMIRQYPNARILDVGGGHGQLTRALVQNGYNVTVLGSAEVCNSRIQNFLDQGLCSFKVGDILNLPYTDQSFDVVISYRLLAHVNEWQRFLGELTRVAHHAVLVDYPSIKSLNYIAPKLFKFKKSLEGNTRPFTCFKETELLEKLNLYGFYRSDRYCQFFLPMVMHRTLKLPPLSKLLENISRSIGLTKNFGSPVILKFVRNERKV